MNKIQINEVRQRQFLNKLTKPNKNKQIIIRINNNKNKLKMSNKINNLFFNKDRLLSNKVMKINNNYNKKNKQTILIMLFKISNS